MFWSPGWRFWPHSAGLLQYNTSTRLRTGAAGREAQEPHVRMFRLDLQFCIRSEQSWCEGLWGKMYLRVPDFRIYLPESQASSCQYFHCLFINTYKMFLAGQDYCDGHTRPQNIFVLFSLEIRWNLCGLRPHTCDSCSAGRQQTGPGLHRTRGHLGLNLNVTTLHI